MSTTAPSWRGTVEWWTDPRLAYAAGLADGFRQGYDACDQELVSALTLALGGEEAKDYGEAVRIHHRRVDQKKQRDEFATRVQAERGMAA